ncbi:SNF2-related protein [Propioniciclava sinopodophylli]|uniref:DEAD/DEAH box helicase n=1 Tax=Propioniciclava sinopodophylli TaxID=1837344 RepID=UPI002492FCFA|nr:SNF2-related protein [Propioniciclava sinopodophylli]
MTIPDWVSSYSDTDLERRFGAETVARGQSYAEDGRVRAIRPAGDLVMATVLGSAREAYQCSVVATAGPTSLVATCTCPVRRDCKHAAALLLAARRSAGRRGPASWQLALSPLVPRPSSGRGTTLLALQVNASGREFTLRPLRPGHRDAWIKAGATWDDVRLSPAVFDPEQREAVLALLDSRRRNEYAYGHRADALPLRELHTDVWEVLARARATGVPLVPGEGPDRRPLPTPELLADPLVPVLHLHRADGAVRLEPRVLLEGEEVALDWQSLVGRPAHGAAFLHEGRLVLARLERPLDQAEHQLFTQPATVTVPEADLALFGAGFLPALRRRMAVVVDDGVEIPEGSPPTLVCAVEFGEGSATVRWGFRYRLGGDVHSLGLAPAASDPPIRDLHAESALARSVPEGPWSVVGPRGEPELRPSFLTGRALFGFTARTLPMLQERDDVEVELSRPAPTFRRAEAAPVVSLTVSEPTAGDWFNLAVEVTVDGEVVPFAALFAALTLGQDHLLLDSGTWFDLDRPELEQLRALIEEARLLVEADGDTFRLRPEHVGLWAELVELGVVAEQSAAWQESVGALMDLDELPETPLPDGLDADLRPYQHTGFSWLSFLWRTRLGGILADEMGLGKTLQTLALAQSAHEAGELTAPVLVVAPTSVLGTWVAEAAKFTPGLRVTSITESHKRRRTPLADAVAGAHIVVTSYTLLRLEADAYAELDWSAVLLDEAQFVKNHRSQAYQAVRKLRSRVKIALTGTPLENNLMDLWSLLSITAPGLFPHPQAFTEAYRKPIEAGDADALARLHRRIRPLVLRRTKSAVAAELPDKQEQVVPVELAGPHRRLYDRHLARERQKVLGLVDELGRNRVTILRSLTLLRQLSLSPALIDEEYPAHSAKIDTLLELLDEVVAGGHRALVFSQFTGFLALVRQRLDDEGISYSYLDGRTRDRAARIGAFRTGDDPVFLISLKAGGFGLTLTEADYVFILDPWWNPAAEAQAIDRAHRIGQDKPVNVYRLVSADTIEEKVVALADSKRHLFDEVVGATSDMVAPLSADDIRGLLLP